MRLRCVPHTRIAGQLGIALHTKLTIGYDVPWPDVHRLLAPAAERIAGIELDPKSIVLQISLGEISVEYELNAYMMAPRLRGAV